MNVDVIGDLIYLTETDLGTKNTYTLINRSTHSLRKDQHTENQKVYPPPEHMLVHIVLKNKP